MIYDGGINVDHKDGDGGGDDDDVGVDDDDVDGGVGDDVGVDDDDVDGGVGDDDHHGLLMVVKDADPADGEGWSPICEKIYRGVVTKNIIF